MLPKCTRLSVQALKIPGVKKLGGRVPQRGKGRSDTYCVCAAWLFVYPSSGGAHAVIKESVALSRLFPSVV